MSVINKVPAFVSHGADTHHFRPINVQQQATLAKLLHTNALIFEELPSSYEFPYGFYRARHAAQAQWHGFYKVLPLAVAELENHSARFEALLAQSGLAARQMQVQQQADYCVCTLPYLQLRNFCPTSKSVQALAEHLKQVHICFAQQTLPQDAQRVANNWQQRLARFKSAWQTFRLQGLKQPGLVVLDPKNDDSVAEFCANFERNLALLNFDLSNAQVIHGDLNPGNVMEQFVDSAWQPLIIDYENSHYSYMPKIVDVAMLIQRLLLTAPNGLALARLFLKHYGALDSALSLSDAMKISNIRSQCILIERYQALGVWSATEWQKFVDLIAKIEQNATAINQCSIGETNENLS